MTTQIEAMKSALAAMEHSQEVMLNECGIGYIDVRAITALRAAIEQAEKCAPAAWMYYKGNRLYALRVEKPECDDEYSCEPLYLHPPSAEIEELRRDAARYRYLRHISRRECLDKNGPDAGCWIDCEDEQHTLLLLTEEDADRAIDAAMEKDNG